MTAIKHKPIFTRTYNGISDFQPDENSCYIYAESVEDRSGHIDIWRHKSPGTQFIKVIEQNKHSFTVEVLGEPKNYYLRSIKQLSEFIASITYAKVYLDITGLSHNTWAPLTKYIFERNYTLMVVYVEPFDYRPSLAPTEGEIFDLSEKIEGIAPIPGYISLSDENDERVCFVPLIGFEGARFSFVLEQVQPPGDKIIPIIGVPGFKPEYPYNAYLGNKIPLMSSQSYRNVRFATANCPFSLCYLLEDISTEYSDHLLKIAPIGTKPHALGAILFAIQNSTSVELVYDHPIRKPKRTEGTANLHVYYITSFLTREANL